MRQATHLPTEMQPTDEERNGPEFYDASRLRVTLTRPPESESEYVARLEDENGNRLGYASGMRWPFQIVQLIKAIWYAMTCLRATHYRIEPPTK